jgi:hypothetical protein
MEEKIVVNSRKLTDQKLKDQKLKDQKLKDQKLIKKVEQVNDLGRGLAEIVAKMDEYKVSEKHKSVIF